MALRVPKSLKIVASAISAHNNHMDNEGSLYTDKLSLVDMVCQYCSVLKVASNGPTKWGGLQARM